MINNYKLRFNEAYRDNTKFKERVDKNSQRKIGGGRRKTYRRQRRINRDP